MLKLAGKIVGCAAAVYLGLTVYIVATELRAAKQ